MSEFRKIENREINRIQTKIDQEGLKGNIEAKEKLKQEKQDFEDSGHKRAKISKEARCTIQIRDIDMKILQDRKDKNKSTLQGELDLIFDSIKGE